MRNLHPLVQRWTAIFLPPLAILVCCVVVVPRQKKLSEVNRNIRSAQASVNMYLAQLDEISKLPPDPTVATMPMTKQEQSDFLRGLSQICTQTGNKLISVNSLAVQPPPPPAANAPPAPPGSLPIDVIPIRSNMVFEGSFTCLKDFLTRLKQSRRLVSLTECRIGAGEGGFPRLQTSITITRYVDTPEAGKV